MKWKDEYKLGNDTIDKQHEELFSRVAALIEIVVGENAASRKQECIDAILFLKGYAVKHFTAEEEFQKSLGYKYLDYHKAIHLSFVDSVLDAEEKLMETDFSVPTIKEVCGFLCMWLVYHVAGADQKIVEDDIVSPAEFALAVSYEDCVLESLKSVLGTLFGGTPEITISNKKISIENAVSVEIEYNKQLNMRFTLAVDTALWLVNSITNLGLTEVDELAGAVLSQIARTIRDMVSPRMKGKGQNAKGEKTSPSPLPDSEFFINTKFGRISTSLTPTHSVPRNLA